MCGIFAAINLTDGFSPNEVNSFRHCTDLVSHRGPDDHGFELFDKKGMVELGTAFNVFLGHRRLSILDLSKAGHQPMQFNGYWIIFNGEIFNFEELRLRLVQKGVAFQTKSDTEVIIKAYEAYGPAVFAEFNGMWAFILLDFARKKILISRDRFSEKPLFYFKKGNSFYFASEIKQLTPLVPTLSPNISVVNQFILQNIRDHSSETFYSDISRVNAKAIWQIDIESGSIQKDLYWDYHREDVPLSRTDALEKFKFLLEDSVKVRLRSDVPVGALLSGGLDSSAIVQSIDPATLTNFNSFSFVSDDKRISEDYFIDTLVKNHPHKNTKFKLSSTESKDLLNAVIRTQDEPFSVFSVVAEYSIFKTIRSNTDYKVILSGQGGDEILMGYLKYYFFYLRHLLRERKFSTAMSNLLYALFRGTVLNQFKLSTAKRYIPFLIKRKNYLMNTDGLVNTWSLNTMSERQIADIDRFSVPVISAHEDRNSMAFGIELRYPFLDYRLVNYALSLDNSYKIDRGWTKLILRQSMNNLPSEIRWRKDKKGFSTPEESWLKNEWRDSIIQMIKTSVLAEYGVIDRDKFMIYFQSFLKGKAGISSKDIFVFLITEKWLRMNFGLGRN
jgi:asparagine synthase (glutamine-hydrolysing)